MVKNMQRRKYKALQGIFLKNTKKEKINRLSENVKWIEIDLQ